MVVTSYEIVRFRFCHIFVTLCIFGTGKTFVQIQFKFVSSFTDVQEEMKTTEDAWEVASRNMPPFHGTRFVCVDANKSLTASESHSQLSFVAYISVITTLTGSNSA